MSVESTRATMMAYWQQDDLSVLADDVTYTNMGTGEEYRGREAIAGLLRDFYHGTFDARTETINTAIADGHALFEGYVVGTHTGTFLGIPPTGKQIALRGLAYYRLEGGKIAEDEPIVDQFSLLQQLGAGGQ